jgi:acyl-coenzyme A thioesterase PaaI-like protein
MTSLRAPVRSFATVTALTQTGAGRFDAVADPEWTVVGKPNGGYLLAMLARAALRTSGRPDVLASSAHFLHSPAPGPVSITAEVLRDGRSAAQVRVTMEQDGRRCVDALLTVGALPAGEPQWAGGVPSRSSVGFAECQRLMPAMDVFPVAVLHQVEVRLEHTSLGFTRGQPSGRGELRGWLALPDGAAFDSASLQFALDAFPPATFDIDTTGWVPTLELTTYVRAVPVPGPVQVLHRAHLIQGDRVDESCHVWDSAGRLVAHSTQLAGIRFGR